MVGNLKFLPLILKRFVQWPWPFNPLVPSSVVSAKIAETCRNFCKNGQQRIVCNNGQQLFL